MNTEKSLAKTTEALPASVAVKDGAEVEPNNTILQANIAKVGESIGGQIDPANDIDYFKFRYLDDKERRDIIVVHLENLSSTLRPQVGFKQGGQIERT